MRVHPLWWVLAAGILVRAGLWFYWADLPPRIVDAQSYNQLALGILNTGSYVDEHRHPTSLRPPLYPAFIAVVYHLFGAENYGAVRVVQAAISLMTAVVVFRLGTIVFNRRVGLVAAACCCLYPSFLGFNNLLVSETLFTFFVTAVALCCVEAAKRGSLTWLALAGVLLGCGALTRSILWLFVPLLALLLLCAWPGQFGRRVAAMGVVTLAFAIVIAPWSYRNTKLQKTFTLVDVMGGRNAMMGNYEYTPMERSWATISDVQGDKAWHRVLAQSTPGYAAMTQGERDKAALRYGLAFVKAHPWLTVKRDLVRFFNFWQLERTLIAGAMKGIFGPLSPVVVLAGVVLICGAYAAAIFAGLFGLFMARPKDRWVHWLFLAMIALPCVVHTLIFAHSRYHLPIMPIVLLYAAAALVSCNGIWQRRGTWQFKAACVACGVLAAGWLRELIVVDLQWTGRLLG